MRPASFGLFVALTILGPCSSCALAQQGGVSPAASVPPDDLLVVLADTGRTCGDLPVLDVHPDASRHRAVLTRGFSGRLLRLYRWEQLYLHRRDGRTIEPAYLLLSDSQGGFPRYGFCLGDQPKPDVAYVDLHRDGDVEGRFGAMDQIFPHELLHIVLHHLAGEPPEGGANQVHALGVRTDPVVAFDEGFAEHAQVVAIDDADAAPATAALARDTDLFDRVHRRLREYERALTAWWAPAPRARLGFLLWYNQAEQALRYHGVKANLYAREPLVPAQVLVPGDPYRAYLLESVLPGNPLGPARSSGRLRSTEGVVSSVILQLVTASPIRDRREPQAFYEAFGARQDEVDPQANAYLKVFTVFAEHRTFDLLTFLGAFARRFPGDAAVVRQVARDAGLDIDHAPAPEIWLSNRAFTTGTTLFDQFRGVPRPHTFDLNAASRADLLGVPGVDLGLADAILRAAPFAHLDEVGEVAGMSPAVVGRLREMAEDMRRLRAASLEGEAVLNLQAIVMPSVWRGAGWLAVCWVAASVAYGAVRRLRWIRLALNGLLAAILGLGVAWILGPAWWVTAAVPLAACAAPAAAWQALRRRRQTWRVVAAWTAASVPAVLLTVPWP